MIRIFRSYGMAHLAMLMATMLICSSCLKDDDDDEVVYPGDAAIVAFSIGDFIRTNTTTSSTGADSTYSVKVTGSTYKFYIDQVNRQIYNATPLPYGTNVSRLQCNISSKNSSSIVIKSLISDTLFYYSSTDSIDFSTPRQISAYSLDGSTHVDYQVTVNVRQDQTDVFQWNSLPSQSGFAEAQALRMFHLNGRMYVFAAGDNTTAIYSCPDDGTGEWSIATPNFNTMIPAAAVDNVVATDDALYLYLDGMLMKSGDGSEWSVTAQPQLARLVAADAHTIYALSEQQQMISSSDDGQTWSVEQTDADASLLPTAEISYCRVPSRINSATESVVIAGSRPTDNYFEDLTSMVWNKVVEYADNSRQNAWMYLNNKDVPTYYLPRLSRLSLANWNNGIIAIGGAGIGACTTEGFSQLYYSKDGGIFWEKSDDITLPTGLSASTCAIATNDNKDVWMVCGGSGQVWYGQMPGSDIDSQKIFTE